MKEKKFKNATPFGPRLLMLFIFSCVFRASNAIAQKCKTIGEVADFSTWVYHTFGKERLFSRREALWKKISGLVKNEPEIRIIELGVAWGYATNWFLTKGWPLDLDSISKSNSKVRIDAFDRFNGLPTAWRTHLEGFFDNGGVPPNIEDGRVTFHKGNVEETIRNLNLVEFTKSPVLVLFDLDLFEPSLAAYEFLKVVFKEGDFLYFDEAFYLDERRLIEEYVLNDFNVDVIGFTSLAICLRIISSKQ
jgi:hypothetical protein